MLSPRYAVGLERAGPPQASRHTTPLCGSAKCQLTVRQTTSSTEIISRLLGDPHAPPRQRSSRPASARDVNIVAGRVVPASGKNAPLRRAPARPARPAPLRPSDGSHLRGRGAGARPFPFLSGSARGGSNSSDFSSLEVCRTFSKNDGCSWRRVGSGEVCAPRGEGSASLWWHGGHAVVLMAGTAGHASGNANCAERLRPELSALSALGALRYRWYRLAR